MSISRSVFAAAACLFAASGAHAVLLDFGAGPTPPTICSNVIDGSGALVSCSNGSTLSQTHGDIAGVVDVTYSAPRVAGGTSLQWWSDSYNNLYGVAFAQGADSNSLARIEIRPLQSDSAITLQSFELGAWSRTTRPTALAIYAIGSTTALFSYTGLVGNGVGAATLFSPGVSSTTGLRIEWADSAYNVGIDNIQYTATVVPEPSAALLLATGGVALGWMSRRRRRA